MATRVTLRAVRILPPLLVAPWFLLGCAPTGPARFQLAAEVDRPAKSVVVFFADGLDVQRLDEMLDAGLLPNIRRTFVDRGVRIRDAICSMPSITYPNNSSIMTGLFPGHHGIMGNYWFDRGQLATRYYMTLDTARDVNVHLNAPTMYDMLSDRLTVSVLAQTHKGVTVSLDLKSTFDWGWILGDYIGVDRQVGESITDVFALANRVRHWPTIMLFYHPGVDETGHRQGPDSPAYADALENFDANVGLITGAIATAGLADSTYYALIADHGMPPIRPGQDFRFIEWLERERRLAVLSKPLDAGQFVDRFEALQSYDAVATVDAGRVAMIHLRGRHGWMQRPGPGEVRNWAHLEPAIHALPAVQMVAARGQDGRVQAWSRDGSLTVERRVEAGRKLYRIAEQNGDPLGYLANAELNLFVRAGWHDSQAWLVATAASRCPDFVPQLVEMFDSPHAGDLVVFAAEGWLLYPNERAGHGSIFFRDMHVPMFFAGPDLPAGTEIALGRLVDFVPTLLGLLGESHRLEAYPSLDGIDRSAELRLARVHDEPVAAPTPPRPRFTR